MIRCLTLAFFVAIFGIAFASPVTKRDIPIDEDDNTIQEVIDHLKVLGEALFGLPSNETGEKVRNWSEEMGINPEELGSYVEGDILFPMRLARNGLKALSSRWPRGVIPYTISPKFNAEQKQMILEAMNDYHKHTCIKFKPYTGRERDYIRIIANNAGCYSSVGRIGGAQDVNLQVPGCMTKKGTVIHELMHAAGFLHEQSRSDRDNYVIIQWENISRARAGNFMKSSKATTDPFGVEYNYKSVMHYSATAFSKNGLPTIKPRNPNVPSLGQREGFSNKDILKIRRMYNCS